MTPPQYLPSFLGPLYTYQPSEAVAILAPAQVGGTAAAPNQKIITSATMIGQEQSNWCWSAVTQAVNTWAGTNESQADIATAHINHNGRAGTCDPPNDADSNGGQCAAGNGCAASCNDPHILSVVLNENGRFSTYIAQNAAPAFTDIASRINNNKPVPCRVQWQDGGGHFILVTGWTIDSAGTQQVHVLDPASVSASDPVPERVLLFSQFVNSYTLSGAVGSINYAYEVQ